LDCNYKISQLDSNNNLIFQRTSRGSLADRAGLDVGDIILQIDGEPTWQTTDVYVHLLDAISGDVLRFSILRGEKRIERTMEIP